MPLFELFVAGSEELATETAMETAAEEAATEEATSEAATQASTQAAQMPQLSADQVSAMNPSGTPETPGGINPVGPNAPPADGTGITQGAAPAQPATPPPSAEPMEPAGITQNMPSAGGPPQITQAGPGMSEADANALNDQLANMPRNQYLDNPVNLNQTFNPSAADTVSQASANAPVSPLQKGIDMAKDFITNHPIQAGLSALQLAKAFGSSQTTSSPFKSHTPYNMANFKGWSPNPYPIAGRAGFANGGPVEAMAQANSVGNNTMYPMSQQTTPAYSMPSQQRPISQNILDVGDTDRLDPYTGMPAFADGGITQGDTQMQQYAHMLGTQSSSDVERDLELAKDLTPKPSPGIIKRSRAQESSSPATAATSELNAMMKRYGIKSALPKVPDPQAGGMQDVETTAAAAGGIMHGLGGYSDGGRLLKGPGDGVSDSIPAQIGDRQPARLADGEFVVPARIVSELGNGSTEAGARKLYGMMDRVQKARGKTTGKGKVAVDSKADKNLPV